LPGTLAEVGAERVYLVPMLMAEGYTLRAMLRRLEGGRELSVCRPVGANPRLAELIGRKAQAARIAQGWAAEDTALLLVGHGTERHAASGATTRRHAAELAARGGFAEAAVAFLDQAPTIAAAVARLSAPRCVAVGLFLDRGEHGEQDIPRLLATTGHQTVYAGPIGTDPEIATLIIEQVRERDRLSRAA
jgi:sirohydrochlorin cobaltochelatase